MTLRLLAYAFDASAAVTVSILLPAYLSSAGPFDSIIDTLGAKRSAIAGACLGALSYALMKWVLLQSLRGSSKEKESMYGLEHGRLHLQVPTAMWMNMGYWGPAGSSKTLAEACRDLLKAVLAEAEVSGETRKVGNRSSTWGLGAATKQSTSWLNSPFDLATASGGTLEIDVLRSTIILVLPMIGRRHDMQRNV
jgi:hypothetical protein